MELTNQNINIDDAIKKMHPIMALVVYSDYKRQYASSGDSNFYIEQTDIVDGIPGASKPLTIETTKSILSGVTASESGMIEAKGLLPRNILYMDILLGDFTLIWYRKSSIQELKFSKELNLPNYNIKVPAMIYKATRQNLSVYSVKTNKVPNENTPLFPL